MLPQEPGLTDVTLSRPLPCKLRGAPANRLGTCAPGGDHGHVSHNTIIGHAISSWSSLGRRRYGVGQWGTKERGMPPGGLGGQQWPTGA